MPVGALLLEFGVFKVWGLRVLGIFVAAWCYFLVN